MTPARHIKLDNPAWHSLNEAHQHFFIGNETLKLYQPKVCTFGGIIADKNTPGIFDPFIRPGDSFFIIGKKPNLPPQIILEKEIVCLQMICPSPIKLNMVEKIHLLKGSGLASAMGDVDPELGVPGVVGTIVPTPRLGLPSINLSDGPAGLRIEPKREGIDGTFYC